ncbi:hypothetical protein MSAN_00053200 [Mycena sanguinolenta]|uniref:Uncharacterized protein n=1 Tax=Mycena sanguinolenta TaxID=230812 RepID=A0A8H7DK61_9AGAR|nr:hypothetical protein MSAN_00053200 [Mycena sanguinolenta]
MGIPAADRPDETSKEIFSEHTWVQGAFLACVAYGMAAILFFQCINLLLFAPRSKPSRWTQALTLYITVMFVLSTLYIAALCLFTQESFIDGRNIPGGPNAFEDVMFSSPVDMLANATLVILSWFADLINASKIWRCYVIYRTSSVAVITLPVLMLMASIGLGICWLKQVGTTSASPWATNGINFTTPYFAMSLALNMIVTVLIVVRLMLYRRRIKQALPSGTNHSTSYVSLATIVFESAAIYSVFSLLFLVPFAFGHPLSQLFLQALSPVQIMASFLIIFRIAQGKAWCHKTVVTIMDTQTFPVFVQTNESDEITTDATTTYASDTFSLKDVKQAHNDAFHA